MDELERTRMEVTSLKQELAVLRQAHELTLLELAEAKENESRYRKLNDALVQGIEANKVNLSPMPGITLNIEGEFGCQRCLDLEKELDSYRTGVNCSLERRVREFTRNFTDLQEEDRRRSRVVGGSRITNHIHYNSCQNCPQIEREAAMQQELFEQAAAEYEERIADRDILAAKITKMEALISNLQEENAFLEGELEKYRQSLEERQDYYMGGERVGRASVRQTDHKSNKMMQEISNIVNCLSSKKFQEDKRRSRAFPATNDTSLFSIKNGINRPNGYF